jgi:hypothetical protein
MVNSIFNEDGHERDSCPEDAGVDPVYNIMSYSPDAQRTVFTPGQVERMVESWNQYRA